MDEKSEYPGKHQNSWLWIGQKTTMHQRLPGMSPEPIMFQIKQSRPSINHWGW
jgi:hypothetical protein